MLNYSVMWLKRAFCAWLDPWLAFCAGFSLVPISTVECTAAEKNPIGNRNMYIYVSICHILSWESVCVRPHTIGCNMNKADFALLQKVRWPFKINLMHALFYCRIPTQSGTWEQAGNKMDKYEFARCRGGWREGAIKISFGWARVEVTQPRNYSKCNYRNLQGARALSHSLCNSASTEWVGNICRLLRWADRIKIFNSLQLLAL